MGGIWIFSEKRFIMLFATVNVTDQLNIMHFFLEQAPHPPPKPHDHTYISVERVDADNKYASNRYNLKSSKDFSIFEFLLLIIINFLSDIVFITFRRSPHRGGNF